jgi:hypothetical protein
MNLIPFALLPETDLLVDVADVASGRKCGCICPSCKIPLIAKKGEIKEWHFSHDSKYIDKDQVEPCDFSWSVAVKMMLKQLLMEGCKLLVPDYFVELSDVGYKSLAIQVLVTKSSLVKYQNPILKELSCDVVLEVCGKKLGVILFSKKQNLEVEYQVSQSLVGLIGINVNSFAYDENGNGINHLRSFLKLSLEDNARGKFWLYHARQKATLEKEEARQRTLRNIEFSRNVRKEKNMNLVKPIELSTVTWHCVSCNHLYQGESVGLNPCPKCQTHFYRKQSE